MKILFISHTFPPTFGGVEKQNFQISESLKKHAEVKVIANGKGKIWLPVFLPLAFIKAFFLMFKYDVCLMGNGVLAPIGATLKLFHPKSKFVCIVHGLDITFVYKKGILAKIYKFINIPSLKMIDKLFMVGNFTIEEAEKVGISKDHCVFIPNGLNINELVVPAEREDMESILGTTVADKKIILRIARFVPHKGVEWFIRNVLPKLPENYFFIAVGGIVSANAAGNENNYEKCEKAIKELGLENRAKIIGDIPEEDKLVLLNAADLYVTPNIKHPGSSEGFGITAIEGAACSRVVLASDIEGLKDAIIDGKNGFLVEHENSEAWVKKIKEVLADDNFRKEFGEQAYKYIEENYTWNGIAGRYIEEIQKITNKA